ncbi:MAG TPA: alpha/beta fold hydrolase [Allosphingosinicella sp.]
MIYLLFVPLTLYLLILLLLFTMQTRMVFPAGAAAGGASPLPPGTERLSLTTPNGDTLHGSRIPAARDGSAPLILGFGGNAWNADAAALTLHGLYPQAEIVIFHYRGYAPSTGTPSAKALNADALLIHDEIVRRAPGRRVVAVGFSVGTGVAAHLAANRPLAGAILVTPFDDLARVAADHYPWLPVRLLFRHRMDSAAHLRESRVPVAIVAAGHDTLILPRRTDALRAAVANLAYDRTIRTSGHNDIYDHPTFPHAMREALSAVLR